MAKYDKDKIISEIKRIAMKLGKKSLSISEFKKYSNISRHTVCYYFISWNEAVKEAGLEPIDPIEKLKLTHSKNIIPEEDLKRFAYSENDLLSFRYNDSFIELMKFECERARKYFEIANDSFHKDDRKLLFPARIMQKIYFNILLKIEKMNYNVFHKKAKISMLKKLYYTFGVFVKYKLAY